MPAPTATSSYGTVANTGNYQIDSLIGGTYWQSESFSSSATVISYSFPGYGSFWSTNPDYGYGPSSGDEAPWSSDFAPLNATQKAAVRAALESWSNVANIQFVEVGDTSSNVGTIRFAFTGYSMEGSAAYAYYPGYGPISGDVWINAEYINDTEWGEGSYHFSTLIHEIGHALGLKHPFDPGDNGVTLPSSQDDTANSVMSYSALDGNSRTYNVLEPSTPMAYDILAIQALYGANASHNSGNSTYSFAANGSYYETIWDAGGIDTIVATGSQSVLIDLTAGSWSQLGAPIRIYGDGIADYVYQSSTVRIAYGVLIENATGGNGNDTITGNDADNVIIGGAGSDSIVAGLGGDYIDVTGGGNNYVNGGNQGDTILGGSGSDELRAGKGLDYISGGAGNDTLYAGLGTDTMIGGSGSDVFVVRGYDERYPGARLAPRIEDFEDGIDRIAVQNVTSAEVETALTGQQAIAGGVQFTIAGAIVTVLGVSALDTGDFLSGNLFV